MFNKRLYEYRKSTCLKKKDLAKKLGISESYYNLIENNKRTPSKTFLKKLVAFTNKNEEYWLYGIENAAYAAPENNIKDVKIHVDFSNSIIGQLSFSNENVAKLSIEYLQKIGFNCDSYKQENLNYLTLEDIYVIEFKEKPSILKTLENMNLYNKHIYIKINSINEYGVGFYVLGQYLGYGDLFVPMSNINAIHTITEEKDKEIIYLQSPG